MVHFFYVLTIDSLLIIFASAFRGLWWWYRDFLGGEFLPCSGNPWKSCHCLGVCVPG